LAQLALFLLGLHCCLRGIIFSLANKSPNWKSVLGISGKFYILVGFNLDRIFWVLLLSLLLLLTSLMLRLFRFIGIVL